MEIVVTGRHTQIKQRFRDVVESKMNRVTAIAPDAQRVQIVLSHEGNPRQADTAKRVEITVIAGRTVVSATFLKKQFTRKFPFAVANVPTMKPDSLRFP